MSNLIISENYLKEYTTINNNVDIKIVTPVIQEAQTFYILPILGTQLYNQIISQVGSNTVSAANVTLLDNYVVPCLMYYVKCELIPEMKYRMMNKGVMIKNSENSQPADLTEIQFLMDRAKNKAEELAERTTRFLRHNSATYPLYTANAQYDEIRPNRNNYTGGIFVGDLRSDEDDCNIIIGNY